MKFDANKLTVLRPPAPRAGQPITAADLRAEQEYQRAMQWQHNRLLHGYGIVVGLEVMVQENEDGGAGVVISPGYALDGWGRELVVPEPLTLSLPRDRRDVSVYVRHVQDTDPSDETATAAPNAAGEFVRAFVENTSPERALAASARADFAVALARLRRPHLVWQRDRAFRPPRAR